MFTSDVSSNECQFKEEQFIEVQNEYKLLIQEPETWICSVSFRLGKISMQTIGPNMTYDLHMQNGPNMMYDLHMQNLFIIA